MNHPLLNILVGGHSIVPDASVQEGCRMTNLPNIRFAPHVRSQIRVVVVVVVVPVGG